MSQLGTRRRRMSEFEQMVERGWTLIAPDGTVFRKRPDKCICPDIGAAALCPIHGIPDELKGSAV